MRKPPNRTRRGRKEGSVSFHAGKGLWQARRTIKKGEPGYRPGKQTQRSAWGATKEEALAKLAELAENAATPRIAPGTFAEAAAAWEAHATAARKLRPNTVAYYAAHLRTHVLPAIGPAQLPALTGKRIDACLGAVETFPSKRGAWLAIRIVLAHALPKGAPNPIDDATKPQPEQEHTVGEVEEVVRAFTAEQASAVLRAAAATGPDVGAIYAVFLGAGLRRGELFGLQRSDFDAAKGALRIERTLHQRPKANRSDKGESSFTFGPPKTKRSKRTVALPAFAIDALARHLDSRPAGAKALIFAGPTGGPVDKRWFDRRVHTVVMAKARAAQPDLPALTPHELRHTHATLLLASGELPLVVAARLGHSVEMLLEVYGHCLPGQDAGIAARLDASLISASKKT